MDEKSRNRWHMTKWVLGYLGVFCTGLFLLAAFENIEAVKALLPLGYGILCFGAGLLGVNLASPAGGWVAKVKEKL